MNALRIAIPRGNFRFPIWKILDFSSAWSVRDWGSFLLLQGGRTLLVRCYTALCIHLPPSLVTGLACVCVCVCVMCVREDCNIYGMGAGEEICHKLQKFLQMLQFLHNARGEGSVQCQVLSFAIFSLFQIYVGLCAFLYGCIWLNIHTFIGVYRTVYVCYAIYECMCNVHMHVILDMF